MWGMEHPLKLYRDRENLSLERMARDVGTSKSHLSKIENRRQFPSMPMIARIVTATNGVLSANDFLPPPAAPAPSQGSAA
jgi:transcriptional regulator with XRE-family HTH domain